MIQNSALRAIFKKKHEYGNKNLLKQAEIASIRKRMNKLNNPYLKKRLAQETPIICDLNECYKKRFKQIDRKDLLVASRF